jgi:hypothetical protein
MYNISEAPMGLHDRDWYREKKIDWDRGGLKSVSRRSFWKDAYELSLFFTAKWYEIYKIAWWRELRAFLRLRWWLKVFLAILFALVVSFFILLSLII